MDTIVAARRIPRDQVLEFATGEVFSGQRSLQMNLVDEIGDWHDARLVVSQLGGLREPRAVYRQPKRTLGERLLGRTSVSANLRTLLSSRALYLDVRSLTDDP